jgi:hypothetical protein
MNLLRSATILLSAMMFWKVVANHNQSVLRD